MTISLQYRCINQHNSDFSSKLVSDLLLSFFSAQNGCIHISLQGIQVKEAGW